MCAEITQYSLSTLSNLLSGLLGAIIGGVLSFVGSLYGSKIQVKSAEALYQDRENAEFRGRMFNLLAEIKDNIDASSSLTIGGPTAWIRFLNEMWHDAKGDLIKLPVEVQGKLRNTYAEIHRYNSAVDTYLARGGQESAIFQDMWDTGNRVKELLIEAYDALNGYLNDSR